MTAAVRSTTVVALDDPGMAVLNALPSAVVMVDGDGKVAFMNAAAEGLFAVSAVVAVGQPLAAFIAPDSPLLALIHQIRNGNHALFEYDVAVDGPRVGHRTVAVQGAPHPEVPGAVVLGMQEHSIVHRISQQFSQRNVARSVTAMAAMLAHEVRNPLSGIRGAAQLLEEGAKSDDLALTNLIRREVDRILALVDRMDVFSDDVQLDRDQVNIHEVLDHVRLVASHGFGANVTFRQVFDPSLPAVLGDRDQLVQIFLNLVKNACEACADRSRPEVLLTTRYQHGVRVVPPGSQARVHLPLVITVQDNGPGIPEDMRPHLFDPFVSSKPHGTGLGLPLVAKLVAEHGGVIEFESGSGSTVFQVMLPMAREG